MKPCFKIPVCRAIPRFVQPNFTITLPFARAYRLPFSAIAYGGAILGASNPQNRVNAPENPQAGDFRERSHSSFTNCLLCDIRTFCQLVPFDCSAAVKGEFLLAQVARLSCLKPTQPLGENSCFPPDPFSACYRVLHGFAVSRRAPRSSPRLRRECLRRLRTFF